MEKRKKIKKKLWATEEDGFVARVRMSEKATCKMEESSFPIGT